MLYSLITDLSEQRASLPHAVYAFFSGYECIRALYDLLSCQQLRPIVSVS